MSTYVVGDIHGGLKGLLQVLEKVPNRPDDTFIFVGDYVDGWSESAETIRFLLSFSEKQPCIFTRGNHDELLYNYLMGKGEPTMWLNHGGQASKDSYAKISEEEKRQHIQFLESLHNYHIDGENKLYLHAGFTNLHGPQNEYFPNVVYWDRTLWEMVCALNPNLSIEDENYPKRLKLFSEIYIGHTPVTRIGKTTPTNFANVWNIDTGAAFKGPISIINTETKEFWQSDPVWTLYPNENGRN